MTTFDLLVIGAGITGLAAADRWLTAAPEGTRVLILEQESRPGGAAIAHTHRCGEQEFIAPGGALAITRPRSFHSQVLETLTSLGFSFEEFELAFRSGYFDSFGCCETGFVFGSPFDGSRSTTMATWTNLGSAPLSKIAGQQIQQLINKQPDWLEGLSDQRKIEILRENTCESFLRGHADLDEDLFSFLRTSTSIQSGMHFNQHPALDAVLMGYFPLAGISVSEDGPAWPGLTTIGRQFFPNEDLPIYRFPTGNQWIVDAFFRKWKRQGVEFSMGAPNESSTVERSKEPVSCRLHLRAKVDQIVEKERVVVSGSLLDTGSRFTFEADKVVFAAPAKQAGAILNSSSLRQAIENGFFERFPMVSASILFSGLKPWINAGVRQLHFVDDLAWQSCALQAPTTAYGGKLPSSEDVPVTAHALGCWTSVTAKTPSAGAQVGQAKLAQASIVDLRQRLESLLLSTLSPFGLEASDILSIQVEKWTESGYAFYLTEPHHKVDREFIVAEKAKLKRHSLKVALAGVDFEDSPMLDAAIYSGQEAASWLRSGGLG